MSQRPGQGAHTPLPSPKARVARLRARIGRWPFVRIPVAYATLLAAATGLAWVLDRTDTTGGSARRVGATAGLAVGIMGLAALWTAVEISGLLVAAGSAVLVAQGWVAATVLTWPGGNRALTRRVVGLVIAAMVVGQVAANILG